ncbi:MAG: hypothetical protein OIN87_00890 [Candidatus Methanoperedens sp.]|nr:hypothetical protein [Candidatus Methanoperedens sp.]
MILKSINIFLIFLIFSSLVDAVPENYRTSYTIDLKENGTAIWNVEYRTLLSTKEDFDSFDNYSKQMSSVYIPEFTELMQRSASEASSATSRDMVVNDFKGNTSIQSTPTGKYGIVSFSFTWTKFAKLDPMNVGDVFAGGLFLSKDNSLIIKYPPGFTVDEVTPAPDQIRDEFDELIWYGLRSFAVGEPRIILSKAAFPWGTSIIIVVLIAFAVSAWSYFKKKKNEKTKEVIQTEESTDPHEQNTIITEVELMDAEERIMKVLKDAGGEIHQSKIVRILDLPKSSVSSALNQLHEKKLIIKIKKGRENLIRLVQEI